MKGGKDMFGQFAYPDRWFPWKEEPEWNYHHFAHRTKKAKAHAKPKRKTKGGRKHA